MSQEQSFPLRQKNTRRNLPQRYYSKNPYMSPTDKMLSPATNMIRRRKIKKKSGLQINLLKKFQQNKINSNLSQENNQKKNTDETNKENEN
ncbi:hydroxyproline-rich glycoprotein family protein [Anaeramoeba flamelloides]|uniref:Hydroxyproline-rich glycoprotein family protein n=1 Tax=Anaeramoeba flamelloides TaxID=1746091 RepID=A0AAV7Y733_9EUKA|nr:hydroxyproline-rich glycoprotein family protein [Anaeramoeba flamelloides]KAJ6227882.1 hydroxyproline-rich glycoprotein family protein [Anaeramoeba flamelloides]